MRPYVVVVCMWVAAVLFFENAYYAFRFPERYVNTRSAFLRGLPREPSSAAVAGAGSLLFGLLLFGIGLFVLHGVLSN